MSNSIRVLIADDHDGMRRYIMELLSGSYQVVGVVSDGDELVKAASWLRPDVIVSDVHMPRMNGPAARRKLSAQGKLIPFVFVSVQSREVITSIPKESSVGLVYKNELSAHLAKAVEAVKSGEMYCSTFYVE